MELFNPRKLKIPFDKFFQPAMILSLILLATSFYLFTNPGPNYGIDFRGGVQTQLSFTDTNVTEADLRQLLGDKLKNISIQSTNDFGKKAFLVTSQSDKKNKAPQIINSVLTPAYGDKWKVEKVDFVGPKIGANLKKSAIFSLIYTCLLIAIYMWWRFDVRFAPGALACIFHDLIITTGFLCLTGIEFSTTIIAALLTLAGYSINDTVVVFDRIREMDQKLLGKPTASIVREALNSCLSRTLITSGTTLAACAVLFLFGGPVISPFAATLFFGIIVGTYSSIFVASPLYLYASTKIKDPNSLVSTES